MNINVSRSAAPELAQLRCEVVKQKCLCPVSLGLKEVQMGAHDFKLNKVPLFALKSVNINVSLSAAPKLALVPASRYDCNVNWSYHNVVQQCQVSLGLKEVQMGAHDFKLYNVPFFARKPVNFNVSRSAAPQLDLVPASCYMLDVKQANHKVCAKFH